LTEQGILKVKSQFESSPWVGLQNECIRELAGRLEPNSYLWQERGVLSDGRSAFSENVVANSPFATTLRFAPPSGRRNGTPPSYRLARDPPLPPEF